eukprot:1156038-Pelagomonas_calceolata.AAC.2
MHHSPVQRVQQLAHAFSTLDQAEYARHTECAQHRQEARGGSSLCAGFAGIKSLTTHMPLALLTKQNWCDIRRVRSTCRK